MNVYCDFMASKPLLNEVLTAYQIHRYVFIEIVLSPFSYNPTSSEFNNTKKILFKLSQKAAISHAS